jgi:hypothetical protein
MGTRYWCSCALLATLSLWAPDLGAVALSWQLFDTWSKECQYPAKAFLRIFLAMPVMDPSHPAPCLLRVEAKHFWLPLILSPICEYRILSVHFLHHIYSECPMKLFKWTRSPVFTNNKHTLFSWVDICGTRSHSALSQTPVWRSRLDVTVTIHIVEGYDSSA